MNRTLAKIGLISSILPTSRSSIVMSPVFLLPSLNLTDSRASRYPEISGRDHKAHVKQFVMKVFKGLFIILLHLVIGNVISFCTGEFIPGSVLGMIILFLSLMAGIVKEDSVRDVALFLTDNMAIFFIPALIGILEMWGLIKMHFLAWVALLTITALLVMAVSGWAKQLTDRIRRRK